MLVIKVELWPGGLGHNRRELGRMKIANVATTADQKRGNYRVKLMRRGNKTVQRTCRVDNYPRLAYPVWELVRRALNTLHEEKKKGG
tara:strand:- start:1329 stop:1589 length:261 start_codon:yes stop_codon:yes gene_type:complete